MTTEGMGEEFEPDPDDPIVAARMALDAWDAEDADEISAVFAAIYERPPDDDEHDDAVSHIFAARDCLSLEDATRVLDVLG